MAEGEVGFQDSSILGKKRVKNGKSAKPSQSRLHQPPKQSTLRCPECSSERLYKDGLRYLHNSEPIQRWLCRDCEFRFSDPQNLSRHHKELKQVETIESNLLKSRHYKVNTRQICAKEAKNLTQATETKTVAGDGKQSHRYQRKPVDPEIRALSEVLRSWLDKNGLR